MQDIISNKPESLKGLAPSRRDTACLEPVPQAGSGKINVLVLESTLIFGGVENLLFNIFTRLDPARFEVRFCTFYEPGPMGAKFIDSGCEMDHSLIPWKYDPRAFLRLRSILRRQQIDFLYLVTQPLTLFWGLMAAQSARVPVGCLIGNTLEIGEHAKLRIYRLLLPFVDVIVSQAELQRNHLVNNQHLPARLMRVIHNGVDSRPFEKLVDRAEKLRSLGLPSDARVIGLNGRMVGLKGVDVLLRAGKKLIPDNPNLHVVMVGSGPEIENYRQLARDLGLAGRAHFLGYREDLPEITQLYDVAVLSSRTEAFPMVVLEYMASGRPIVATNVGSVSEVLEDGVTGLLAPPEKPDELAAAIGRLLNDSDLARRCAISALASVKRRFTIEQTVQKMESLIMEIVGRRRIKR